MEENINPQNEPQLPTVPVETIDPGFRYFPFFNKKQPIFVLLIIGLIFYCSSLFNESALDDGIIIHQNDYVLKGIRGIKDILTKDAYDSFYKRMNASDQLQGGRYRPVSVITFAIEQEFIGSYRTGSYNFVEDLNKNGKLDEDMVSYRTKRGPLVSCATPNITKDKEKKEAPDTATAIYQNYEYNNYVDVNQDGAASPDECFTCWDQNRNFKNDWDEDLNDDGVFNEIDCQVNGAFLRHFNNMWLYILGCILLYVLLSKYWLRSNQDIAFLAALLFLCHPIHTEHVANIKGRDELLSLIFICLCFLSAFKFLQNKTTGSLVMSGLMFLFALLSKEYAIMLLVLIPVSVYVFSNEKIDLVKLVSSAGLFFVMAILIIIMDMNGVYLGMPPALLFGLVALIYGALSWVLGRKDLEAKNTSALLSVIFFSCFLYLAMRLNAVNMAPGVPDTEILNNPYLLADGAQKFATKTYVLLKYLRIIIFPHPLISDYSYATLAYRNLSSLDFILSLIIHIGLIVAGVALVRKRQVMGFAIITYLVFLLPVSNYFFDTGGMMHEGNLFHSSIGFAIAGALIAIWLFDKVRLEFSTRRTVLLSLLCIMVVLFGCKTWERNRDWKNDVTLFLKDVKNAPNSVLVLGNAGARWIDLADTKEITGFGYENDNPKRFNDYNGQLKITDEEMLAGNYSSKRDAALYRGIGYLERATELHPRYVNGFLNLGLAYFKLHKEKEAIIYWKLAERLYPDNPYLQNYYAVYGNMLNERGSELFNANKLGEAVYEYNKLTIITPKNKEAWYKKGGTYYKMKNYEKARACWNKALELDAGYKEVLEAMTLLSDPEAK